MYVFHQIFGSAPPSITWWQIRARAVLIFVYAIALLRRGARRALGKGMATDVVAAAIVGSALSRALRRPGERRKATGTSERIFNGP
jgi:hypothetical protein